ncbi:acetyltransferase [Pseudomonas phage vB_PaeS_PAO1_Ab19]|uniref:acetyltransferase n=1 Tax=Pseudomonas phage vB_PaeS_PAO1_Ab19 TaxID=1548912 RepID=UPI0018AFC768|nr:acetyltransferase [Pseudomonas phage vB_PaeS_PAO1_Ab19]
MTAIVRRATLDEHKAILQVAKQSKYTKDFSNQVMFSSPAAYEKGWICVAELDGEIRGFYCIREKVRSPETVLYFIGVDQEAKGRGLGKQLIEHIMASTRHRRLALNVNKQNEEAQAFYQRLGFQVAGESLGGQGLALFKEW